MTYPHQPLIFMIKGSAYRKPFLAGAGGFHFTISEYIASSLDWVLQQDWDTLQIKPLD